MPDNNSKYDTQYYVVGIILAVWFIAELVITLVYHNPEY